ncbi:hypothetical protein OGAPHI_003942 [Ogataea philodendri]|uniref:Uncharacterized protein n=1 Tax=Ogataea philodendri TaxID=1378263 RepID=A0A9P8P6B4_9ASCO|nr:uncharacterized protein OGAPHI_003942 [Ogataea philodendri]KAH3665754.1 hypothetical protein OGAPHI_003942 [Ogataea philodendri]
MKARVAMAHLALIFSNMAIPAWARAAAMEKEGMVKAAIPELLNPASEESPDSDKRSEESSFWSWNTSVSFSVTFKEPGLDRHEEHHETGTHHKVQIRELGAHGGKVVVVHKHSKDTVKVQEQQTVSETVEQTEENNNWLGGHHTQSHNTDKLDFAESTDLVHNNSGVWVFGVCDFVQKVWLFTSDGLGKVLELSDKVWRNRLTLDGHSFWNNDSWQKHPLEAQVDVLTNSLTNNTSNGRTSVGRENEKRHWLRSNVRVSEEITNSTSNIRKRGRTTDTNDEHEDGEHRHVFRVCTSKVENNIQQDRNDINPFSTSNIGQRTKESWTHTSSQDEHGLTKGRDLGGGTKSFLDNPLDSNIRSRSHVDIGLQKTVDTNDEVLLPNWPVVWMVWVVQSEKDRGLDWVLSDILEFKSLFLRGDRRNSLLL